MFIKENGNFRGSDTPRHASKVINVELGIDYNFHALRHTHATMLIESGLPVKTVSDRLGHSTTRTTLDIYVHVTEQMKNDAVDRFEEIGNLSRASTIVNFKDIQRKTSSIAN